MENKHLFWIIPFCIIIGIILGIYLAFFAENLQVGKSKLYNCIYNNLEINNFPQSSLMIEKIENECICFRQHNFTNLSGIDCSNYSLDKLNETKEDKG